MGISNESTCFLSLVDYVIRDIVTASLLMNVFRSCLVIKKLLLNYLLTLDSWKAWVRGTRSQLICIITVLPIPGERGRAQATHVTTILPSCADYPGIAGGCGARVFVAAHSVTDHSTWTRTAFIAEICNDIISIKQGISLLQRKNVDKS